MGIEILLLWAPQITGSLALLVNQCTNNFEGIPPFFPPFGGDFISLSRRCVMIDCLATASTGKRSFIPLVSLSNPLTRREFSPFRPAPHNSRPPRHGEVKSTKIAIQPQLLSATASLSGEFIVVCISVGFVPFPRHRVHISCRGI